MPPCRNKQTHSVGAALYCLCVLSTYFICDMIHSVISIRIWRKMNGRWCHLVKATEVTTGLAASNGILPLGGLLIVTCGLTACTLGPARGPMLGNEYG